MADEIACKGAENGAQESTPADLPRWAQWLLRECEAAAFANFAARCLHRVTNERGAAACNLRDGAPCDPSFCPRQEGAAESTTGDDVGEKNRG